MVLGQLVGSTDLSALDSSFLFQPGVDVGASAAE
jgi:hypothetical protein